MPPSQLSLTLAAAGGGPSHLQGLCVACPRFSLSCCGNSQTDTAFGAVSASLAISFLLPREGAGPDPGTRASLVSDVEVLKVERIQLIDAVLNLCTYHHPENIQLPPG